MRMSNRAGFALPMAIFVIAVLTAALAAGYSGTTTEFKTNAAVRGQNRAFELAQGGLEQFLVRRSEYGWCQNCAANPAVADSEWTRVSLVGGYADVVAVKVRPMVGNESAVYFIRSRGRDTTAKINSVGGTTYAERTVGIYATWNTATMDVKAAWMSLTGLTKNGTGIISGIDECGQMPAVAGVLVDKGDLEVVGNSFNPAGNPPVDTSSTFAQLKAATKVDWASIQNNAIWPDIEIPGGAFPSESVFDNDPNYWPVIRIHTNGYSLPNRGRGMIIADSNFVVNGSNMWDGVILIGGTLTSNGNNTVAGATLSGLNYLINGQTPTIGNRSADNSTGEGQKNYVYNSCYVANAVSRLKRYVAMPNSWMDNLTSW